MSIPFREIVMGRVPPLGPVDVRRSSDDDADERYFFGEPSPLGKPKAHAILEDRPDDFDVYYIPETRAVCTLRFVRETMVKMGRSPVFMIPANWEKQ